METVNKTGFERAKYVKGEVIKLFIIGPLNSLFLLFLMYFSFSKNLMFFYIICLPFTLVITAFLFIYAPLKMIRRHNNTIQKIEFSTSNATFITFPILWIKSQRLTIPISEIQFKRFQFPWYGKGKTDKKEGIIFVINNKEFYFVKDYFENYDRILSEISAIPIKVE
jgi:hypothetical protein